MRVGIIRKLSEIVAALVRRITVAQDQVTIEIDRNGLAERLLGQEALLDSRRKDHPPIPIEVPVRFRRRGVEAKLVVLDQRQLLPSPTPISSRRSHALMSGSAGSLRGEARGIGDIARAERLDRAMSPAVLCLAFLAPEITKVILEGRQPTELTAKRLISSALKIPPLWPDQLRVLLQKFGSFQV